MFLLSNPFFYLVNLKFIFFRWVYKWQPLLYITFLTKLPVSLIKFAIRVKLSSVTKFTIMPQLWAAINIPAVCLLLTKYSLSTGHEFDG
jgi:cell shape-determining protein MreD